MHGRGFGLSFEGPGTQRAASDSYRLVASNVVNSGPHAHENRRSLADPVASTHDRDFVLRSRGQNGLQHDVEFGR